VNLGQTLEKMIAIRQKEAALAEDLVKFQKQRFVHGSSAGKSLVDAGYVNGHKWAYKGAVFTLVDQPGPTQPSLRIEPLVLELPEDLAVS
jgi:hypothetical protein